MEKELARWIFWEDDNKFYCYECCMKRVDEVNTNKEYADSIDYEGGQECGYFEDYANVDYPLECCKCSKPLYSKYDLSDE